MENFQCQRCGEIFHRYDLYISHVKSKYICSAVLYDVTPTYSNYITTSDNVFCDSCNKTFIMDQSNLKIHKETCK
jgi:5-methylcytosine-specific restriction endonuclease McrA